MVVEPPAAGVVQQFVVSLLRHRLAHEALTAAERGVIPIVILELGRVGVGTGHPDGQIFVPQVWLRRALDSQMAGRGRRADMSR
jgi:hypothetical protein